MHLKVFVKLKKNPKNPLVRAKKPQKTQKKPKKPKKPKKNPKNPKTPKKTKKTPKNPKKPTGLVFFLKTRVFPTLPGNPGKHTNPGFFGGWADGRGVYWPQKRSSWIANALELKCLVDFELRT
jgi:hypothetical protein